MCASCVRVIASRSCIMRVHVCDREAHVRCEAPTNFLVVYVQFVCERAKFLQITLFQFDSTFPITNFLVVYTRFVCESARFHISGLMCDRVMCAHYAPIMCASCVRVIASRSCIMHPSCVIA